VRRVNSQLDPQNVVVDHRGVVGRERARAAEKQAEAGKQPHRRRHSFRSIPQSC
jgi:hypothetical protein